MSFGKLYVQPANSDSEDKPKVIDLKVSSAPLLFGWNEGCGIRILRKQVAGEHAQILRDKNGKVWLVHLDEVYHTMVNGELVKDRVELRDKDIITIAGRDFVYEETKEDIPPETAHRCPSSIHHHHQHGRSGMYVAPLEHWTNSYSNNSSQSGDSESISKDEKIRFPGTTTTDTSQNSITNPKREKPADVRCVGIYLRVHKKIEFGSGIWISGSTNFLGNWEKEKALRLQWTEGDIWTISLEEKEDPFPLQFEYKYLVRPDTDTIDGCWEPGENRKLTIEKNKWNSESTPFYVMQVKDTWEERDRREISLEALMQETVGETYQEYTMHHIPNQPIRVI